MAELGTADFLRDIASRHCGADRERLEGIASLIDDWDAQDARRAEKLSKAGLEEYIYA